MAEVKNYFQVVAITNLSVGAADVEQELARLDINKDKVVRSRTTTCPRAADAGGAGAAPMLVDEATPPPLPTHPPLLGRRSGSRSSGRRRS